MNPAENADSSYTYSFERPVGFIPQRVVSLVPSMTESLFDLNLGKRLVGITDFCKHPADQVGRVPRVGGTKTPNLERIIALRPDLVLMNGEENRIEDAEAIQAAGIAVWATQPNTVQEALNLLWQIMDVFEEPSMVPRVRLIENTFDWINGITRDMEPVRVFVPIWRTPWMSANSTTYMHDLLRVCGGANVFADEAERYPELTLDQIIAAAPDVILLPDEPFHFTEKHAAELKEILAPHGVPAAVNDQILLVDGSLLTWHGTRIAFALRDVPPVLGVGAEPA